MSQHALEDLVEQSIRLLHEHDAEIDHRSAFNALWEFQERGDCGFTHFRVLPILLERRATYRFTKDVHPAIETLEGDGVTRELGFVDDAFLYCDAGTELWKQLLDELRGDDQKPPQHMPLSTLALHIARAAEKANDLETIAAWFNFGPKLLFGDADAMKSPEALELKAIVKRTQAEVKDVEEWHGPLWKWWFG